MFYGKVKFFRSPDPDDGGGGIQIDDALINEMTGDPSGDIHATIHSYLPNAANPPAAAAGTQAPAAAGDQAEVVVALNAKIAALQAENTSLKAISPHLTHPLVDIAMSLAAKGETDVNKLISELNGNIPDPASMSPEASYEFYVRNKLAPSIPSMTEDSIKELLTEFSSTQGVQRFQQLSAANDYIASVRTQKMSELQTKLQAYKSPSQQTQSPGAEEDAKVAVEYGKKVQSFVGKELYGLKVTDEDAKHMEALASNMFFLWTPDGKPMYEETRKAHFFLLNEKRIVSSLIAKGFDMKVKDNVDGIPKVSRTPGVNNGTGHTATNPTLQSVLEKLGDNPLPT